ncbi:hypothetical protein SAMD00019534_062650 [Acytostelium subglobosum LB1]|uniref:hypothetical protein n=1 Tax=Acytostelium subglobosum LB1 TaxID=1410327 RepID=UPI0006448E6E|nr:hypothetical protein SAMD00019534_062650 [Acytostelium subglobosum LB1]GAM23090.1 hypothetical protein SAMD00019534_062650 [Acytostelium subglobosum LB1]|eukprot:XP_012754317.1 hypothetical protein SAMD00019534_062650 [Acytostelium subglobosum LB1]
MPPFFVFKILEKALDIPVKICQGENVFQTVANSANGIISETVNAVVAPVSLITEPVPFLHNAVEATKSVVVSVAEAPVNIAHAAVSVPVTLVESVANGDNVLTSLGQCALSVPMAACVETIKIGKCAVEETISIATGQASERVRSGEYEFGARVFMYADEPGIKSAIWKGAYLAAPMSRFTHVIGFKDWPSAFEQLTKIANKQKLSEVQISCHGCPGGVFVDDICLSQYECQTLPSFQEFMASDPFLHNGTGLIWFRSCKTFNKVQGRLFAKFISDCFKVRVAGHTVEIPNPSPFVHAGFQLLHPNQTPEWEDESGDCFPTTTFSPSQLEPIYIP